MTKSSPRTLFYDIETTHNIVATFDLREEYTPHTNVLQERYVVCAAWRWRGESKIHTVSVLDNPKLYAKDSTDDSHVIETLHDTLSQADVIVAHNGDQFDKKYLNTRTLYHGLGPMPPVTSVDTYKIAKQQFKFNSNRLDYVASFLGVGKKKDTPPGLWLDVLKGDKKAVQIMVDYNKHDVVLLEGVFEKLTPYIPEHINRELFGGTGCPRCGSFKMQSRGTHAAKSNTYRRFQCQNPDCMGWFREAKTTTGVKTKYRVL